MDRKGMKVAAKITQKKHYWMIVIICLVASVFGVAYTSSTLPVSVNISINAPQTEDASQSSDMYDVLQALAVGNENSAYEKVRQNQDQIVNNDTDATFGRQRGVIASLLNSFASGSLVISVTDAINSVTHNGGVSIAVPVILSLIVYVFVWLFIRETYRIVMARMLLEGRFYNKLPASRFLYPIHTRKWPRMAWIMFVENVFLFLWSLTIVGYFIKQYSYRMVPYIVAENPNIEALDAIRLSRHMMKGHKWECFVADCSFLGWYLLNLITFGLSGIFYFNGYNAAFFVEYYVYVRAMAKTTGIAGSEMLNDEYLYFKADPQTLHTAYADVAQSVAQIEQGLFPAPKPRGFTGILSEWFGIRILHADAVNRYEEYREDLHQVQIGKDILNGAIYPGRLAPAPMPFKFRESRTISVDRSYPLVNLIMMFFIFCFVGWMWEVSLAFISEGMFVNRGTLHGPWLPIYGTGGVIILVLLKKLREKPALEFIAAMVLCGCLEYFSSWYLEMTHDGQRWWDYTGYFLNINGRICAEGLLTFGLGGLAIVYLLAPALDNLLSRIDTRKLGIVAAVLLVLYCADQVYSAQHPNIGAGITDYKGSDTSLEAPIPYEIRQTIHWTAIA